MTIQKKRELIKAFGDLLEAIIEVEYPQTAKELEDDTLPEMLTIKECSQAFKGLSERAIRQFVAEGKIQHIRVGDSKRGKILIDKKEILRFLKSAE